MPKRVCFQLQQVRGQILDKEGSNRLGSNNFSSIATSRDVDQE